MQASDGPGLFEQVLGAGYGRLADPVQRFHRLTGRQVLTGCVETDAPATRLARGLAWCLGTPRQAASGALRFELDVQPDGQRWTRVFPSQTMQSRLARDGAWVVEKLGAATLWFELSERSGQLEMRMVRLRFAGVPCPGWLLPRVTALESGAGTAGQPPADALHFHIKAALPLVGVVAAYRGHLLLAPEEGAP
ncbi:MAG: DUF4166 domain-containing protein [Polaromonas sp.]|nr:DUF4166 domain-containing protein [Polaromonas sp.]